ncbi:COX15/CtaA family protein [Euzebya tangerina]|uniref:COX15/CtaA family protein n=1 Tax=Euzebya tangerina TaxID=591198 RepID=UPI0013C2F293|nr:COX15/CtaA family protein [Euzebya tangerina]
MSDVISSADARPVRAGFRRLAVAAAITSLVVIAVGGATRATDSGLACPTWPGCFTGGDFLPPITGEFVDGLGRNVTGINIWLEHSHRLVAGLLAVQVAALLVWVLRRYRHVPGLLWPVVVAAVAVNVQALLGALVVWNLVQAELVTLHLGLGTATMVLLIFLAARSHGAVATAGLRRPAEPNRARLWRLSVITTAMLWGQILIGGHLSGIHGGLAFKSRPLLGIFTIGPITIEEEAINVVHRYLAYAVAALVMVLAIRIKRSVDAAGGPAQLWARVSAGLVGLQIVLGVTNLYSDLSYVSVIPHLAVASWILAALTMTTIHLCDRDDLGSAARTPAPDRIGAGV